MNPSTNTPVKTNQPLSLKEASDYLALHMNDRKSASYWRKYLEENVQGRSTEYGGYRLKCEVIEGLPYFAEISLKVFIKLMGSGVDRKSTMTTLRKVDKKSKKNESKRYKIKGASKLSRNINPN
jgi:hypothetical protein